ILASWYKVALKDALLNQVYSNKGKTAGVLADDQQAKEQIYEQYLDAYTKGVFNYIKEDQDASAETVVPRQYFSGGELMGLRVGDNLAIAHAPAADDAPLRHGDLAMLVVGVQKAEGGEEKSDAPKIISQAHISCSVYGGRPDGGSAIAVAWKTYPLTLSQEGEIYSINGTPLTVTKKADADKIFDVLFTVMSRWGLGTYLKKEAETTEQVENAIRSALKEIDSAMLTEETDANKPVVNKSGTNVYRNFAHRIAELRFFQELSFIQKMANTEALIAYLKETYPDFSTRKLEIRERALTGMELIAFLIGGTIGFAERTFFDKDKKVFRNYRVTRSEVMAKAADRFSQPWSLLEVAMADEVYYVMGAPGVDPFVLQFSDAAMLSNDPVVDDIKLGRFGVATNEHVLFYPDLDMTYTFRAEDEIRARLSAGTGRILSVRDSGAEISLDEALKRVNPASVLHQINYRNRKSDFVLFEGDAAMLVQGNFRYNAGMGRQGGGDITMIRMWDAYPLSLNERKGKYSINGIPLSVTNQADAEKIFASLLSEMRVWGEDTEEDPVTEREIKAAIRSKLKKISAQLEESGKTPRRKLDHRKLPDLTKLVYLVDAKDPVLKQIKEAYWQYGLEYGETVDVTIKEVNGKSYLYVEPGKGNPYAIALGNLTPGVVNKYVLNLSEFVDAHSVASFNNRNRILRDVIALFSKSEAMEFAGGDSKRFFREFDTEMHRVIYEVPYAGRRLDDGDLVRLSMVAGNGVRLMALAQELTIKVGQGFVDSVTDGLRDVIAKYGVSYAELSGDAAMLATVAAPADFKVALEMDAGRQRKVGTVNNVDIWETPLDLRAPGTKDQLQTLIKLAGLKVEYKEARLLYTSGSTGMIYEMGIALFNAKEIPSAVVLLNNGGDAWLAEGYGSFLSLDTREPVFYPFCPVVNLTGIVSGIDGRNQTVFVESDEAMLAGPEEVKSRPSETIEHLFERVADTLRKQGVFGRGVRAFWGNENEAWVNVRFRDVYDRSYNTMISAAGRFAQKLLGVHEKVAKSLELALARNLFGSWRGPVGKMASDAEVDKYMDAVVTKYEEELRNKGADVVISNLRKAGVREYIAGKISLGEAVGRFKAAMGNTWANRPCAQYLVSHRMAFLLNKPGSDNDWFNLVSHERLFDELQGQHDEPVARSSGKDNAMMTTAAPGGIDLNANGMEMDLTKEGRGIEMTFDPAMVAEFEKGNFTGVEGIILQIIPLVSPLPLLGLSDTDFPKTANGEPAPASGKAGETLSKFLSGKETIPTDGLPAKG
ncbi:MAG TPA: hypothetical protein VLJ10_02540, partial [Candidatus Bathyarchaeia archaeon]|nr:hypothetical protein [Candidatus Bathyarchaeia archaeon]